MLTDDIQQIGDNNTRLTTPADHKGMRLTTWHERQKLREFLESRMGWQKDPWIQKWLAELDRIERELSVLYELRSKGRNST
jgi:hypothetical protein